MERNGRDPIAAVQASAAEGKRKNSLDCLKGYFPGFRGLLARTLLRRCVYGAAADLGALFCYGHFDVLDTRRGEYIKAYARNVFCTPLLMGDLVATFNLVENLPAEVKQEEKGGGYMVTATPGKEPEEELSARPRPKTLPCMPGDIRLEACPECGVPIVPMDFRDYRWGLEEGTITGNATGRRMASMGMERLAAGSRELEAELGEDITRIILAAQREHTKSSLAKEEFERGYPYLRHLFALRGSGNLVSYDAQEDATQAVVENAVPPLLAAGTPPGAYGLLTGRESGCRYDGGDDAILSVEARSR